MSVPDVHTRTTVCWSVIDVLALRDDNGSIRVT